MAQDKKSFLLYCDIIHTVNKLPDDKAGQLLKHILAYVNDQNPVTDDFIIEIAFEPIKQALKRDLRKYENRCNKNTDNAHKRWDKKNANGCERMQSHANDADSDTDIDIGIDTESDIESDTDKDIDKKYPSSKPSLSVTDPYHNDTAMSELIAGGQNPSELAHQAQTDALIDRFRRHYATAHPGNQYCSGQWDDASFNRILKRTPYNRVLELIESYFRLQTDHTIDELCSNVSDEFRKLKKRLRDNPVVTAPAFELSQDEMDEAFNEFFPTQEDDHEN